MEWKELSFYDSCYYLFRKQYFIKKISGKKDAADEIYANNKMYKENNFYRKVKKEMNVIESSTVVFS